MSSAPQAQHSPSISLCDFLVPAVIEVHKPKQNPTLFDDRFSPSIGSEGAGPQVNLDFTSSKINSRLTVPEIADQELAPLTEEDIEGMVETDPKRLMTVLQQPSLPETIRALAAELSALIPGLDPSETPKLRSTLLQLLNDDSETIQIGSIRGLTRFLNDLEVEDSIQIKGYTTPSQFVKTAAQEAKILMG
ncbi:MAG TPA: hypothetical protein VNV60_04085 [Holophagaceae bacterium]|jgi:hypothetical protein|nr:hypothetical protein [Holophagaceae bacterium]